MPSLPNYCQDVLSCRLAKSLTLNDLAMHTLFLSSFCQLVYACLGFGAYVLVPYFLW